MKRWIRRHRTELLLFLLLWLTYAYFYQATGHNEAARFDQMRAIVQDHTLSINKYWWNSADIIHYSKNGSDHIYPNKAPGLALLALVPFAILTSCLSLWRGLGLPEWIYWHAVTYLTTLFTVSLLSAIAAVAIYRVVKQITRDDRIALLAVVSIWLGTLAFPYSTLFFSHQMAASLLAIAFYLLFELGHRKTSSARRAFASAGMAGLLMSASVITEYPTAVMVALLSIYAVWVIGRCKLAPRSKAKLVGVWILGMLIGAAVLILYNLAAFGNPFYIPYESYAKAGAFFSSTYSRGWLGLHWPGPTELLHALASITIRPQIGMLYIGVQKWWVYACNPVLWISLPGLAIMIWKRELRAEGLLFAAMIATYILFIASYGTSIYDWSGASYLGSRHIIPVLPFLALPIGLAARRLRFVLYPLLAISVFYMLLATAIETRLPIPYENPARDLLLPDYLRGRFAHSTGALFDPRKLTNDSTAFNLAKLARVPGRYQLMPLMLWWLTMGGALIFTTRRPDEAAEKQLEPADGVAAPGFISSPGRAAIFLCLFVTAISLPPVIRYSMAARANPRHGLLAHYYRDERWTGPPADVVVDPEINFDWSKSLPLSPPFSVEWTGSIVIDRPDDYAFALAADDGASLEIDGTLVVNVGLWQKRTQVVHLVPGLHPIRVRYFNVLFGGSVQLFWTLPGRPEQIVPSEVLVPPPAPQLPKR